MSAMRAGRFSSDLLLGLDHLSRADREEIAAFFAAVADQRGLPLHTAVLWNSLYFSYDLGAGEYLGGGVKLDPADDGTPIPVGAFVDVPPQTTPLYGEVIYKEGRDGEVDRDTGLVDAITSGARAGITATGRTAEVQEALILDFNAFGRTFHGYGDVQFKRFVRRGWIDEHHHRVVKAVYQPGEPADDLSVFGRYLLDAYGENLFAEFLAPGEQLSAEDRRDLLLRSFETVHQLASECSDLLRIGDYHISRRTVEASMVASDDEPLSGRDVRGMVRRVGDLSGGTGISYTAVGPMVLGHLARHGYTAEERLMIRGPGYATLVCVLNAGLAECVGQDGLLDSRRHLRLDDDWNWGGVWRAEQFNDKPPDHGRFHPLVALGLGYAHATMGNQGAPTIRESRPLIEISERNWTVKLRQLDLDHGDLPLTDAALADLPDQDRVVLDLSIVGVKSAPRTARPLDRQRRMLREINYPLEFFPGVILNCSLGMNGRMVVAQAHPLTVPVTIEEMTLTLEHDPIVFARELGLRPIDRKVFRGSQTLINQIATVFRLHGRPTKDGGRELSAPEVLGRLLGAEVSPATARTVLIALAGMDLDFANGIYTWRPRLSRRTSARERVRIGASRETETGRRLSRRIAPRLVGMHVRQYTSRKPSPAKIASYADALITYHASHRLGPVLPPGCTWVEPYRRGDISPGGDTW